MTVDDAQARRLTAIHAEIDAAAERIAAMRTGSIVVDIGDRDVQLRIIEQRPKRPYAERRDMPAV